MEERSINPYRESETEVVLPLASQGVTEKVCNIDVCICTFRRPDLLKRLLEELDRQETGGLFTFSVVVVDNDHLQTAREIAANFAGTSRLPIKYCVEPHQNIPMARNLAIKSAEGDYVAFIDDDEFPINNWLLTLFNACHDYGADGALGPVKPHFDTEPPQWVIKGKFYDRSTYPTGLVIDWRKGRTGNVLLNKRIFAESTPPFNPEFRQGEDQEFFHRMIAKGFRFVWCDEAVAYETVPPIRWKRSFMIRRALLRGAMEPKTPGFGVRDVAKSLVAAPLYMAALPFALLFGQHRFMSLLVRLFDHLGKLIALLGINPIKVPYVTN